MEPSYRPPLTLAGRLLVVVTLLLAVGGIAAYSLWSADNLSGGRYPLWLFAMPVLLGAALFFGIGAAVLHWTGIGFFERDDDLDE